MPLCKKWDAMTTGDAHVHFRLQWSVRLLNRRRRWNKNRKIPIYWQRIPLVWQNLMSNAAQGVSLRSVQQMMRLWNSGAIWSTGIRMVSALIVVLLSQQRSEMVDSEDCTESDMISHPPSSAKAWNLYNIVWQVLWFDVSQLLHASLNVWSWTYQYTEQRPEISYTVVCWYIEQKHFWFDDWCIILEIFSQDYFESRNDQSRKLSESGDLHKHQIVEQ